MWWVDQLRNTQVLYELVILYIFCVNPPVLRGKRSCLVKNCFVYELNSCFHEQWCSLTI